MQVSKPNNNICCNLPSSVLLKGKLPHSASLYITGDPTESGGLNRLTEVTLDVRCISLDSTEGSGDDPKGEPS